MEGYPIDEALGFAVTASEELKSILEDAGIETGTVIAGASGWGQPAYGHPTVGVHLHEELDQVGDKPQRILELSAPLIERGIQVAVYPARP
jgi:hypothetical protein